MKTLGYVICITLAVINAVMFGANFAAWGMSGSISNLTIAITNAIVCILLLFVRWEETS